MDELRASVLDAHGGLENWKGVTKLTRTCHSATPCATTGPGRLNVLAVAVQQGRSSCGGSRSAGRRTPSSSLAARRLQNSEPRP